jgi:hypothetical protein
VGYAGHDLSLPPCAVARVRVHLLFVQEPKLTQNL